MAARVLFINPQLKFSVTIKQALERIGSFEVHPFTDVDAAIDFLRDYPHDVALVDFTLHGASGPDLVVQLRVIQPDLPIIATPAQPDNLLERLNIQGTIDTPFNARDIIPLLKKVIEAAERERRKNPPLPTARLEEVDETLVERPPSLPEFSPLDDVLRSSGNEADLFDAGIQEDDTLGIPAITDDMPPSQEEKFKEVIETLRRRAKGRQGQGTQPFVGIKVTDEMTQRLEAIQQTAGDGDAVFDKLKQEEPPPPDFEDSGTVGDLMTGIGDASFEDVLKILRGEDVPPPPPLLFIKEPSPSPKKGGERSPARVILEATSGADTSPIEWFSVENLVASIKRQLKNYGPYIRPLPSWDDSSQLYEPDFLPEELPELDESDDISYQTTIPSEAQRPPTLPEDFETESLSVPSTEETAPAEPDIDDDATWGGALVEVDSLRLDTDDLESELFDTSFRRAADFELPDSATSEYDAAAPLELPEIDDPRIAHIALQLTQVSLELTAEEIVLTRDGAIIAYEGDLLRDDLEELQTILANTELSDNDESLIAFIRLESNDQEYMLFARRTDDNLVLSMLFGRDVSLRTIRHQGNQLAEALEAVPEVVDEEAEAAVTSSIEALNEAIGGDTSPIPIVRNPFAYVWVTDNPDQPLSNRAVQAIKSGLDTQLNESQWKVRRIEVDNEYVYLLADVPGEKPAQEVVRDLKRRAAAIVKANDPHMPVDNLWANSYLVITPGRELEFDEIRSFIEFERMA